MVVAPCRKVTPVTLWPAGTVTAAPRATVAGALSATPSAGLVRAIVGEDGAVGEGGASKNRPLTTALGDPVLVTRSVTRPRSVHTRYCPPTKAPGERESSTPPVPASITSKRWFRA